MWFDRGGKVFVSMPGVPHEMKDMMTRSVLPRIRQQFDLPVIHHKIIRTAGIGESWLAEKIVDWESSLPAHVKLAYLPHFGDIRLRLTSTGSDLQQLKKEADGLAASVEPKIRKYIYGYDDDTLPKVVGDLLRGKDKTLGIAESCTGGHIAHAITSVPGSSDYFNGAVVAYQNQQKMKHLGVQETTLSRFGAVSEETVCEMAAGVRKQLDADFGLATSGIAGPGGGTPEKPVGLVWIACSDSERTVAKRLNLVQDRYANIRLTTVAALNLLQQRLAEKDWD
jgi:nicotinamide-nucleotide amidase